MISKGRVLVAMSGGVDSSVAAALLVRAGYDVTGGFMKTWSDGSGACPWRQDRRDALRVAASLDIPLQTFDFTKAYQDQVVDDLLRGYTEGITPNPDVLCNEIVKFGLFWEVARTEGFDWIATGHYAQVQQVDGVAHLYRGTDLDKDQSYFLYRVKQDALRQTLFPIGHLQKRDVRKLATQFRLPVADKPDSQGVCFIGDIDFDAFVSSRVPDHSGEIVSINGDVLGTHCGLHHYTIGQRERIGLSGAHPWYVAQKDSVQNRLIVVDRSDHPMLFVSRLDIGDVHWISEQSQSSLSVMIQARYRQDPQPAKIDIVSGTDVQARFEKPLYAPAVGQSAVFYKGNECLGGGVIRSSEHL